MKEYLIVIEKTSTGFSAYSPDVDGCVATGATVEEPKRLCVRLWNSIYTHLPRTESKSLSRTRWLDMLG